MQRSLITFLGTTQYSETLYRWEGVGEHRTPHIAAALGKLWKADRILVLATRQAQSKNASRVSRSLAAAGCPEPEFRELPPGLSEKELWEQFELIQGAVGSALPGEVLIDITHGFRAQPFFAGAVLSVLRAVDVQAQAIELTYGEYRRDEVSPIWDLTLFLELMEWAQALRLFLSTGVAEPVVELGRRMDLREKKKALASGRSDFPSFGLLVKAVESFADDLATLRVAAIITGYEQEDSKKAGARGSARRLLEAIERCRDEVAAKLRPLALILDQLAESVRPLSAPTLYDPEGQRAQYALARHYLQLHRYPEAAVVVREARVNLQARDQRAVEVNSPHFDDRLRKEVEQRFAEEDPDRMEIADVRNDIEHGGFRKQPLAAKALKLRVTRTYLKIV